MAYQDYVWGEWIDSNGSINPMQYKKKWGLHEFTEEEKHALLSGKEIRFQYKDKIITGHLQYYVYEGKEYFGFVPDFSEEYVKNPVYHKGYLKSTFENDLKKEQDIMSEYMRINYYLKSFDRNDSDFVEYKRAMDMQNQKEGVDVTYIKNGRLYLIDEKAQMDYIYHEKPLPTFSLELLNGYSGAIGWFVNDNLKTKYYMFIWPHAARRPLSVENIQYAHYALVNKEKLQKEVEIRFNKNKNQLLEDAKSMVRVKMGEEVFNKAGECIGYRYKGDGFDDTGYLYYTLSKQEKPVNLVVRRKWIETVSEEFGTIVTDA